MYINFSINFTLIVKNGLYYIFLVWLWNKNALLLLVYLFIKEGIFDKFTLIIDANIY